MKKAMAICVMSALAFGIQSADAAELVLTLLMEDPASPMDISENPTAVKVNGTLASAAGKFGKAVAFDGDNSNVIEVEHADKLAGLEAFTITAWFKCEGIGELEGMSIISKRVAHQNGDAFNIFLWAGGKIHARVNGKGQLISSTAVENGKWYHLAHVFDASGGDAAVRLFINGQQEGAGAHGDAMTNADASPVWIGELDANRGFAWKGSIDEVSIWNGALTEGDIANVADNGLNQFTSVDPQGRLAHSWGRLKAAR